MDTWGISSGAFLAGYVVLLAGTGWLAHTLRRRAVQERDGFEPRPALRPCEIAMLNEGPKFAVATAAKSLRDAGALGVDAGGDLVASGPPPAGAHPLERWVHGKVSGPGRFRLVRLGGEPVMRDLRQHLRALGLVPAGRQLVVVRLQALWLVPLVVLGFARVDVGSANGKPVGFILTLTLAAAALSIAWACSCPRVTERGQRALDALRADDSSLDALPPAQALAVTGATGLWTADAGLAAAIGLPRESGGGSLGGGGDGGGGGCGGCGG